MAGERLREITNYIPEESIDVMEFPTSIDPNADLESLVLTRNPESDIPSLHFIVERNKKKLKNPNDIQTASLSIESNNLIHFSVKNVRGIVTEFGGTIYESQIRGTVQTVIDNRPRIIAYTAIGNIVLITTTMNFEQKGKFEVHLNGFWQDGLQLLADYLPNALSIHEEMKKQ